MVGKVTKRMVLVMDFWFGTGLTAKAGMLLDQHGHISGYNVDSAVLSAAGSELISASALQVLNTSFDTREDEELRVVAQMVKRK